MKISTASLLCLAFICGCSPVTEEKAKTTKPNEPELIIRMADKEAQAKGYPKFFISEEETKIDWSKAKHQNKDGLDVEIIEGAEVELCGGIGCDQ